jgi:hypothetical protein
MPKALQILIIVVIVTRTIFTVIDYFDQTASKFE